MAVSFVDVNGQRQEVELNGTSLYKEAAQKRISFRQLVNQKYPTAAGQPDAFQQFCVTAGLRFKADEDTGIPAARLLDIFDPATPEAAGGTFTNMPGAPDSRILFPAALMEAIENKLQSKEDVATGAFESLVGYRSSVASNRIEQPVLNYTGTDGPESAQFQHIAQNTRPPLMLSLTASDISRKIPTTSIGMEISFEALASNSLDFVSLTMARFFKMANYREWTTQLGLVLAGDPDAAVSTMSAGTSALATTTAASYDTDITDAGVLTQKAYLAWLYNRSLSMTKTHIVCDYAAALAIENRTDRPTNIHENSMDRLDVPMQIIYPDFQSTIKVLVMPAGTFTANTLMGLDQSQALAKITSTTAEYSAVEDIVMKKSREMRIDRGFIVYRLYDLAFDTLTLTV
jgi:hypothetical protein